LSNTQLYKLDYTQYCRFNKVNTKRFEKAHYIANVGKRFWRAIKILLHAYTSNLKPTNTDAGILRKHCTALHISFSFLHKMH